jgi:hypothetical protein
VKGLYGKSVATSKASLFVDNYHRDSLGNRLCFLGAEIKPNEKAAAAARAKNHGSLEIPRIKYE